MKATGLVRRLDDLGRVVIPRELRKTLFLPEGAPMEFFVEDRQILLREYRPPVCSRCGGEDAEPIMLCKKCAGGSCES